MLAKITVKKMYFFSLLDGSGGSKRLHWALHSSFIGAGLSFRSSATHVFLRIVKKHREKEVSQPKLHRAVNKRGPPPLAYKVIAQGLMLGKA